MGSITTIYKRFKEWTEFNVFEKIWIDFIKIYGSMKLDECKLWFKNEYIDSTMIRNLQGIDMIGRNYQDKFGTKISVICDDLGIPLSSTFFTSNVHDMDTIDFSLSCIPFPITLKPLYK